MSNSESNEQAYNCTVTLVLEALNGSHLLDHFEVPGARNDFLREIIGDLVDEFKKLEGFQDVNAGAYGWIGVVGGSICRGKWFFSTVIELLHSHYDKSDSMKWN